MDREAVGIPSQKGELWTFAQVSNYESQPLVCNSALTDVEEGLSQEALEGIGFRTLAEGVSICVAVGMPPFVLGGDCPVWLLWKFSRFSGSPGRALVCPGGLREGSRELFIAPQGETSHRYEGQVG